MPNKTNTDPGGACLGGIRAPKRINETIVLILPVMKGCSSHHLGNRWETRARWLCLNDVLLCRRGSSGEWDWLISSSLSFLQISLWSVLGRHSATWSCTSSPSLGSSEPLEVLPLSLASAVTLITSALLICQNFDMQMWEMVSHTLTSLKWLLRVVWVPDSFMQYSLSQNSWWNQLLMRHFQHHPFFLSAG